MIEYRFFCRGRDLYLPSLAYSMRVSVRLLNKTRGEYYFFYVWAFIFLGFFFNLSTALRLTQKYSSLGELPSLVFLSVPSQKHRHHHDYSFWLIWWSNRFSGSQYACLIQRFLSATETVNRNFARSNLSKSKKFLCLSLQLSDFSRTFWNSIKEI